MSAGAGEKTAGVHRKLARAGFEVARPDGVEDRPIELARDRERAARVAMPVSPSGAAFDQPLIGRRRLVMAPAIAEQPGAEIGDRLLLRLQLEGDPGAVDGGLAPIAVIEGFAQAAIQRRQLAGGQLAAAERVTAGIELAGAQRLMKGGGAGCVGRNPAENSRVSLNVAVLSLEASRTK